MGVKASAQVSLIDMTDAYSVLLTSEAYTFMGNSTGAPSGLSCTTQVVAYCGSDVCSKITIGTITCPSGITASVADNNSVSPTITFQTTAVVANACEAVIPVNVDGIIINKKFSFSVAKQGEGYVWNLVRNGNLSKGTSMIANEGNTSVSVITDTVYGHALLVKPVSGKRIFWNVENVWYKDITYTVSFVAKASVSGQKIKPSRSALDFGKEVSLTTDYKKYSMQIKCTATVAGGTLSFTFANAVGDVTMTNVKLERGTGDTEWAPHPSDLTGAAGKGIKTTAITYQVSSSGTAAPTGTWSSSVPAVGAGQYLWTRTIFTYTDNTTSTSYSVGRMGTNGAAGKGIKATAITYQISASGTTIPTGTWQTSIPDTTAASPYLWTRTVLTYTDNTTATSYNVGSTPKSIQVGGRNLFSGSALQITPSDMVKNSDTNWKKPVRYYNGTAALHSFSRQEDSSAFIDSIKLKGTSGNIGIAFCREAKELLTVGETYTLSFYAKCNDVSIPLWIGLSYYTTSNEFVWRGGQNQRKLSKVNTWEKVVYTFDLTDTDMKCFVYAFGATTSNPTTDIVLQIKEPKLEKGNVATEWTAAPEDVDADIGEAARTATNFIDFTSGTGLQIGDKSNGSWSGYRTKISSSAFEILNKAGTTLASYGEKLVQLGKNAVDSVIELCGGKGKIQYGKVNLDIGNALPILVTNYEYKQDSINRYSEKGYSGTWAVSSTSGIKVGDTIMFRVTNTSSMNYCYIVAVVTKVDSAKSVTATSSGKYFSTIQSEPITTLALSSDKVTVLGDSNVNLQVNNNTNNYSAHNGIYVSNNGIEINSRNQDKSGNAATNSSIYVVDDGITLNAGGTFSSNIELGGDDGISFRLSKYKSGVGFDPDGWDTGLYTATFSPSAESNGKITLGNSGQKRLWFRLYAKYDTISTSDERLKENIIPLGAKPATANDGIMLLDMEEGEEKTPVDLHSELFDRLQPVQYNFIGDDGRICYGLVAQDVIKAMKELGIDENELDLVHHDVGTDENGEPTDSYGIAYGNLTALLIHEVQKLKKEVKELQETVQRTSDNGEKVQT